MTTKAAPTSATPASGSTTVPKTTAAAAAMVTGGAVAKPATEMPLTPGLEQLDEADIAAAFMGLPVESGTKKQKQATNEDTQGDETEETESEEESTDEEETSEEEETEESEETESEEESTEEEETSEEEETEETEGKSDLDKGLEKALKDHPGLRKRIKSLMAENPRLKRELAEAKTQLEQRGAEPEIVTPATAANPFATARSDAELEQQAGDLIDDAEAKLDWLDANREGGTWGKGDKAVEMTAEDVASARQHYRKILRNVEAQKAERKAWLKSFGETRSKLKEVATEILNKDSALPEAKLLRSVPEIMRDAGFLQTLADAKAGREMREKQAQGVKFVEVKAGKVTKPQGKDARPDPKGGKPAAGKKAEPEERKPKAEPLTQAALDKLRADADAGDKQAQAKLDALFLGS